MFIFLHKIIFIAVLVLCLSRYLENMYEECQRKNSRLLFYTFLTKISDKKIGMSIVLFYRNPQTISPFLNLSRI